MSLSELTQAASNPVFHTEQQIEPVSNPVLFCWVIWSNNKKERGDREDIRRMGEERREGWQDEFLELHEAESRECTENKEPFNAVTELRYIEGCWQAIAKLQLSVTSQAAQKGARRFSVGLLTFRSFDGWWVFWGPTNCKYTPTTPLPHLIITWKMAPAVCGLRAVPPPHFLGAFFEQEKSK